MKLSEMIKSPKTEGKEKHVPHIELKECSSCDELCVSIRIGKEVLHPLTKEHYIKSIALFGINKTGDLIHIARFDIGGGYAFAQVSICIKKDEFTNLIASSYCNLHGLWENSLEI